MNLREALERLELPEFAEMGKLGAAFVKERLREPSPLRGLLRPCPSYPYVLMADDDDDGLTHWAGAHGDGVATACGKEKHDMSLNQIKPGRLPTCLWCSVVARTR